MAVESMYRDTNWDKLIEKLTFDVVPVEYVLRIKVLIEGEELIIDQNTLKQISARETNETLSEKAKIAADILADDNTTIESVIFDIDKFTKDVSTRTDQLLAKIRE